MPDTSVQLAPHNPNGLRLRTPVCAAAGTFGYGTEYARVLDVDRLGAIFSRCTTLRSRRGAPPPRLREVPGTVLHATGLQNPGVRAVVREKAPIWAGWTVPVVVNIAGETVEDYAETAAALDGVAGVAGIELNLWYPDALVGVFGRDAGLATAVVEAVRETTTLPVIVKLCAGEGALSVATAVVEAGADALSLTAGLSGMAIDVEERRPYLGSVTGALSGPAVRPTAVRLVHEIYAAVRVPLLGSGGIMTLDDVLQFVMVGASAVQIGTATFAEPGTMPRLIEELEEWMAREGVARLDDIISVAR